MKIEATAEPCPDQSPDSAKAWKADCPTARQHANNWLENNKQSIPRLNLAILSGFSCQKWLFQKHYDNVTQNLSCNSYASTEHCIIQLKKSLSDKKIFILELLVSIFKYKSFGFHIRVTATLDSLIEYFQEHGVLRPRTNPFPCPAHRGPAEPCGNRFLVGWWNWPWPDRFLVGECERREPGPDLEGLPLSGYISTCNWSIPFISSPKRILLDYCNKGKYIAVKLMCGRWRKS